MGVVKVGIGDAASSCVSDEFGATSLGVGDKSDVASHGVCDRGDVASHWVGDDDDADWVISGSSLVNGELIKKTNKKKRHTVKVESFSWRLKGIMVRIPHHKSGCQKTYNFFLLSIVGRLTI